MVVSWFLWFYLGPALFLVQTWVEGIGLPVPDVALTLCLLCGLHLRTATLPGLLLCAALGRSLAFGGSLPLQFLVMAVPVAVLLPLRALFPRQALLWQVFLAAVLAVAVPRFAALLVPLAGELAGYAAPGWGSVTWAALSVPPCAWLLQRMPPLSRMVEGEG